MKLNGNVVSFESRNGIKTVINLQTPGEHASCGNPLEPESGFSYRPEVFMENNSMLLLSVVATLCILVYLNVMIPTVLFSVYFYNFGWNDYGVANLTTVLDMVKVMAFALQEGKIAVHCHAGLGRTGTFHC